MPRPDPAPAPPRILCAGAMLWDVIGQASAPMTLGEDVPGRIHQRPGGVALNVALALARQVHPPRQIAWFHALHLCLAPCSDAGPRSQPDAA